jgi:deazaflavin-dependent oxidoreductase (nitroreductase family)
LGCLGVRLYRLTRGGIARLVRVNVLILTTRGRRSGRERTVLLAYFPQGESFVVVAANGGQPRHPAWYLNLRAARPHAWRSVTDILPWLMAQGSEHSGRASTFQQHRTPTYETAWNIRADAQAGRL